jgi:hypothetical protein
LKSSGYILFFILEKTNDAIEDMRKRPNVVLKVQFIWSKGLGTKCAKQVRRGFAIDQKIPPFFDFLYAHLGEHKFIGGLSVSPEPCCVLNAGGKNLE